MTLQEKIDAYKAREDEINALMLLLTQKREAHDDQSRLDFGVAQSDSFHLISLIDTFTKINAIDVNTPIDVVKSDEQ